MPTFKIRTPVGINQLALREHLRHAVVEATRRGKLRPNSVDSLTGKNSGDNLGPGDPHRSFRAVGGRRGDRDQADPQGRRLRKQEHPVLRPLRATPLGESRPDSGRGSQMHPARRLAGPGAGVQRGSRGRLYRRRPHLRIHSRQGAAFSNPGRHQFQPSTGRTGGLHNDGRQHPGDRNHGLWGASDADRMQGGRPQPPAGQLLRVGGL